ncbi:MAG TPA: alpha/beta hydrolase, partial [Terrimesophilobacter sp.]|nr:alpha/beta hydrolase [Terrimesophilobacter sp.]
PTLVGHSMGTQVVVEAVARHPELSDTIVLIAPTVNAGERRAHTQMLRMLQDLAGESLRVLVVGAMQYLKTGPLWFLRKLRIMLDHDVEHTYPRVRARTLVLRGAHDRVCPRDWVRLVASLVPDAIMEEIPDRGHEAMISTPEPAATMIVEHALTRR